MRIAHDWAAGMRFASSQPTPFPPFTEGCRLGSGNAESQIVFMRTSPCLHPAVAGMFSQSIWLRDGVMTC